MSPATKGRDFLVLWKWNEALEDQGEVMTRAVGKHASGLKPRDRMFVWATTGNELFLLGAIEVQRSGKGWSEGRSLYGPFQIIPLKALKWKLRFQSSADRLSRKGRLAMQVRSRRQPTPETTRLLERIFSEEKVRAQKDIRVQEGKTKLVTLTQRERNKDLRILALREKRCALRDLQVRFCKNLRRIREELCRGASSQAFGTCQEARSQQHTGRRDCGVSELSSSPASIQKPRQLEGIPESLSSELS